MQDGTGNGASENTVEKPVTAASSKTSPRNAKPSTKSTKQPITPVEALELLTSALSYCQQAGLSVIGYNQTNGLVLFIEGVTHQGVAIVVTPKMPEQQKVEKVTT